MSVVWHLQSSKFNSSIWTLLYALIALIFTVLIWQLFNDPLAQVSYTRDIWHHLSVFRELIQSPFDPHNPHVASDDPSRSFTPWTLLIALLARAFEFDQFGANQIAAIISIVALFTGVFWFSKSYWNSSKAALLLMAVMLLTWLSPVNHTGYHSLTTLLFSASYPWLIALALGFCSWAIALRGLKSQKHTWFFALLLLLLAYALFIIHQLQGLFALGATGAFVLFARGPQIRTRMIFSAALCIGFLASSSWFYFDPISFVANSNVQSGYVGIEEGVETFSNPVRLAQTFGFSIFGVLGFYDFARRSVRWELAVPFGVLTVAYIIMLIGNVWILMRMPPFLILYLQLGLVSFVLGLRHVPISGFAQKACVALLAFGLAIGASFNSIVAYQHVWQTVTYRAGGSIQIVPGTWARDIQADAELGERLAAPNGVAIAHHETAFPIEATSLSVVAIPRLFAEVPDMRVRQTENEEFFAPDTSHQRRCAILAEYDVSLIVWRDQWLDDATRLALSVLGSIHEGNDLRFIARGLGGWKVCNMESEESEN